MTIRRLLAVAVLMSAMLAALTQSAGAATSPRWVMGYYVGYQRGLMPPAEIDWGTMTHIVVGPVTPRADGTLDTTLDIDSTGGPALGKQLAKLARAHGVKPMLMIGGAGAHDAFAAAATQHRAALVRNLLALMRGWGYSGLDLDWEPVQTGDQPALSALVGDLRAQAPNAQLTMPVNPVNINLDQPTSFYGTLARKLDRVDVMTYGMAYTFDGWLSWHSSALSGASAHTPTAVDASVAAYAKAGVPKAKLGVGIGFYGMCWRGKVVRPRESVAGSSVVADDNVMSYVNIRKSYYSAKYYRYDNRAHVPYLSFTAPHGPQQCSYVSYEDGHSIRVKGEWARKQGLGAMIVWTINQAHLRPAAAGHHDLLLGIAHTSFVG